MTQLQTIINKHMSLECRCGHSKLVSVQELIGRYSLDAALFLLSADKYYGQSYIFYSEHVPF